MSRENGSVIGPVNTPTSSEAKGVWGLPQQYEAQRAGIWPPTINQYQISRSLRFNSADSANLSRTFSTNGTNLKIRTLSFWLKKVVTGTQSTLLQSWNASSSYSTGLEITSSDQLYLGFGGAAANNITTTAVFRDVSAWYHVVVAIDTTQATASDRVKFYINGSQVTAFSATNYPSQNADSQWMSPNGNNKIGSAWNNSQYSNAYLTEINFIDGQALTPASFGQTNSTTGVWEPIAYTGTYGTNGFYLNFSDNSSTAALGTDYSGNSNTWTVNNFSVTAGVGNDSLVDTPTPYGTDTGAGGEVRGNYATLNPNSTQDTYITYLNGNLDFTQAAATGQASFMATQSTMGVSSGKWYWEFVNTSGSNNNATVAASYSEAGSITPSAGHVTYYGNDGSFVGANFTLPSTASTYGVNDIIGVALDADNGTVQFFKNGVSQGTATGGPTNIVWFPSTRIWTSSTSGAGTFNFGQRPFAYAAPSGFKALCTQNLPTPTVVQGDDYFNTVLWTGASTSSSRSITGVGFQPDFVWVKSRNQALRHNLYDAVRGVGKELISSSTIAEVTNDINGYISAFDSDGFSTTPGSTDNERFNASGYTYVAWNWNAGGSTVTNTAGTISSQVRANPTAGFSIVSWTYGGAATIGHGLNAVPKMIIVKGRNAIYNWDVYHASLGATGRLVLNSTAAFATTSGPWNNTAPTSTVFSQGGSWYNNGDSLIGYLFAEVPGFSAFGSYTGNGSTDGPFVHLGFRPRYILVKNVTTGSTQWVIQDTARMPYNAGNNANLLAANSSVQENESSTLLGGSQCYADWLSNGFKIRANNGNWNTSGNTYIYMAFAENPFKYSLAR